MSLIRPGLAALAKMNPKMAERAMKRPFYSAVDKAITEITAKQPKGTGDQYLAMILKTKGVKPAEVKDRGLDVALKGKGKVSGADLQKLADDNPPPQVKERVLDNNDIDYSDNDDYASINNPTHYGPDQYDDYHTPGGTNYREKLFHLPMPKSQPVKPKTLAELQQEGYTVADLKYDKYTNQASYKIIGPDGNWVSQRTGAYGVSTPEQALIDHGLRQAENASKEVDKSKTFSSSHFGGEGKQLLAHARVQDMKGPNGEKIMLIDEIQSDWHQRGRKKGYIDESVRPKIEEIQSKLEAMSKERDPVTNRMINEQEWFDLSRQRDELAKKLEGVPNAPFKKNWHELVMKRLVDDAAKGGYDRVIITPGAEQAKRYGLSSHVDKLSYNHGTKYLSGMKGNEIPFHKQVSPEDLPDYVGEEVSQKLLSSPFTPESLASGNKETVLSGLDLEVGGHGKKVLYDNILPKYVRDQYGVELGQHPVRVREFDVVTANGGDGFAVVPKGEGRTIAKYPTMEEAKAAADQMGNVPYHSFDITPEMRESITTQGQAFYQLAPVAGAIGAGMMATEEEPEQYRKGGVVRKPVSMDAMRLATLNKQRKRKYG